MAWPVASQRLHQRALRFSPSEVGEVSTLLPFFDGEGRVQRVMLLSASRREIRFFALTEAAVRIPLWGPIDIRSSFPALRVLEYEDLDELSQLWHYDPWWSLTSRGGGRLRDAPDAWSVAVE